MRKINLISVAIALCVCFPLFSQEKGQEEEKRPSPIQHEVVVTATRIETPVQEVASSVTVLTKDQLSQMKKLTVLEALEEIPGVSVIQNGPPGGAASVFLRGANSEHTLVLLDGIELNDPVSPSRACDLAHISLESIERIEILRGPQSTLYGSDALGGIIHIITSRGEGKPSFRLLTSSGSYQTFSGRFNISGGTNSLHYSLGGSTFRTGGFSAASSVYEGNVEKDGYRNLSFSARLGFEFLPNLGFDFVARRIHASTDIDNFGGAYGDDPNSIQKNDALFVKTQVRALLLNNRWEAKVSFSLADSERHYENPADAVHPFDTERGLFQSRLYQLNWQNNVFIHEANTLTFGIDHQQEQAESEYISGSFWGTYESLFPSRKNLTTGLYIQDQVRIASRFFATAGVRMDYHRQSGVAITYRLAPAFLVSQTGTKLKATIGTGFKIPSLYQLYAPGSQWGPIGNENLMPEKSLGWDLGIEQELFDEKVSFGLTLFSQSFKNLILFDSLQGFVNIGEAESRGVEIFTQARLWKGTSVSSTYTKATAKDKSTDMLLLRRPVHRFTSSLSSTLFGKGTARISLSYTGEREDMDFSLWPAERVALKGFMLLNAVVSFDVSSRMELYCRLDNILNARYEMIKGYGSPGFSFYAGAELRF